MLLSAQATNLQWQNFAVCEWCRLINYSWGNCAICRYDALTGQLLSSWSKLHTTGASWKAQKHTPALYKLLTAFYW